MQGGGRARIGEPGRRVSACSSRRAWGRPSLPRWAPAPPLPTAQEKPLPPVEDYHARTAIDVRMGRPAARSGPLPPVETTTPAASPVAEGKRRVDRPRGVGRRRPGRPTRCRSGHERQQARNRQRALGMLIDSVLMRKFLEANTKPVDPVAVQRRLDALEKDLASRTRAWPSSARRRGRPSTR